MQPLVPQLQNAAHRDIQKIAVVRNQHDGVRIIRQVLLQPVAGFQIEVIGRFVEQQQVGLFEQQLGQRDAHLPAAGEFLGAALPVAFAEAEAAEDSTHLGFDGVAVARAELAFGAMKAVRHGGVFGAGRIEVAHPRGQLLLLFLERPQFVEHRHAFGEYGAAGERESFLGQITDGDAALHGDVAGIEALDPGQHLEQGRFSGAVSAHEAGAFLGRHQPIGAFKKDFGPVAFPGPAELNHGSCRSEGSRETPILAVCGVRAAIGSNAAAGVRLHRGEEKPRRLSAQRRDSARQARQKLTMEAKPTGSRAAPPTRTPSISGCAIRTRALSGLTLPP